MSKSMKKNRLAVVLASGAALAMPVVAQDVAQEKAQQATQGMAASRRVIEEVLVTAQRTEETLQDAAIPINAATGEELNRVGVVNATTLNRIAPALYVTAGGGANTGYFVRGVGNFTNNGYTSPAIAFNIDGVYIGRPSSTVASFLDIERVEVLKGPQGTLYGRNATGGAINVIPAKPKLGETGGELTAGYGSYDAVDASGFVNLPLGESAAFRFAGSHTQHDGYFDDGTSSEEDLALRGQVYVEVDENINVRVSADYSTQKGTGAGLNVHGTYRLTPFSPNNPVPNYTFIAAPDNVTADYTGLHSPQTLEFIRNNATAAPLFSPLEGYAYPFRNDTYWGVNAELNFALGFADLVVIPAYRESELDNQFNGPPFKAAINQDTAKQASIEARLSGTIGQVDWLLGGYYFDENVKGVNAYNQFSTVTHNSFDSNTESTAIFGRATWHLSDQLRVVGGVRYTDESRSIDAAATATAGVCLEDPEGRPPSCAHVPTLPAALTLEEMIAALDPALFPARSPFDGNPITGAYPYGPIGYFEPEQSGPGAILAVRPFTINASGGDEEVTWRAALEFDATPDNLLYASYETGFRSGGFNVTFGREEYEPEFIDAFTIGSKNRFLDNRLEVNVELFHWEYNGQQLAALGLDAEGNNAFFSRNVGESTIQGVDVDFQFAAGEYTLFRGAIQYLDATYDKFQFNQIDLSDASDPPNFLTPVTGCNTTQVMEPVREFIVDCSGREALYSPTWTVNLGVQQIIELGDYELAATLDGRYRGDRVIGFNYLPGGNSGSDLTADASLTLSPGDRAWSVTAYVRNLTDEAVPVTYQLGAGNVTSSAYQPPRTYGVRATVRF
ncbi:TonB-dependent receptor [Marinimicrobium alkaliphilum]|uniref:TonB-dependent receptor n=1 Tax=Marinimicrobium alkaliphilum TaxID=2202654 RepID=UPI000DB9A67D|nr:TonB-dependent receptor [Marinimicrobium alkaliphilum]